MCFAFSCRPSTLPPSPHLPVQPRLPPPSNWEAVLLIYLFWKSWSFLLLLLLPVDGGDGGQQAGAEERNGKGECEEEESAKAAPFTESAGPGRSASWRGAEGKGAARRSRETRTTARPVRALLSSFLVFFTFVCARSIGRLDAARPSSPPLKQPTLPLSLSPVCAHLRSVPTLGPQVEEEGSHCDDDDGGASFVARAEQQKGRGGGGR